MHDAEIEQDPPASHHYGFKPSLLGAPHEFELTADAFRWRLASREGKIPYQNIRRVRLSFRPINMQTYRFLTEIWSDDAPRLQIASTSWRSVVEQTRQDDAYREFVRR